MGQCSTHELHPYPKHKFKYVMSWVPFVCSKGGKQGQSPGTGSQSRRKFKGAVFCVVWGKVPQSSYLVGRVASGCFAQFGHEVSDTLPSLAVWSQPLTLMDHAWLLDYRTGDSSKKMEGEDSKVTLSFIQSGWGKKEEGGEQCNILKDKTKIRHKWMLLKL